MPPDPRIVSRGFLAVLTVALGCAAAAAPAPDQAIGNADKVVGRVFGEGVMRRMKVGETLIANQRVQTGRESAADLLFLDQSRLVLGAKTRVILDKFVYDPNRNAAEGMVNVLRGVLRFASAGKPLNVKFKTRGATIGIRGTILDVFESPEGTEVAVHEGAVQVDSQSGSVTVRAGEVLRLPPSGDPTVSRAPTGDMQTAVQEMLALLGHRQRAAAAPSRSLAEATRGMPPDDLIYVDLPYGRAVIETRPDLAPRHVARIKQLVRQEFYDGAPFFIVIPDLVAQTGDPTGTGDGGSGRTLPAEFSDTAFLRGAVGMKHRRGEPDSADSQFFICYRDCSQFNGRYTFWGQVIHGMEFFDQLRPGQPPAGPDKIIRMRVASDVRG